MGLVTSPAVTEFTKRVDVKDVDRAGAVQEIVEVGYLDREGDRSIPEDVSLADRLQLGGRGAAGGVAVLMHLEAEVGTEVVLDVVDDKPFSREERFEGGSTLPLKSQRLR